MIPLSIFYYIYLGLVVIALVFTFFNVYHLIRFGFFSLGTFGVSAVYLIGTALILVITWSYVSQIDWSGAIDLFPKAVL